jgi:hypothetical protein
MPSIEPEVPTPEPRNDRAQELVDYFTALEGVEGRRERREIIAAWRRTQRRKVTHPRTEGEA